jgi:hypothetical protein
MGQARVLFSDWNSKEVLHDVRVNNEENQEASGIKDS